MLVKYYLSDNINALFEDFALDLQNTWAGPDYIEIKISITRNKRSCNGIIITIYLFGDNKVKMLK